MQQPHFDLLSQLQQQPMCRWPICTGLLALLVGLTAIDCGTRAPADVFLRRVALAERQRDARRTDEPAGVTHWQPSTIDLGKHCGPRRWSFVEFPAPGADVAVDARAMGLFLVCFDNNYRGAALARSVARGGTADDEDVASVNNLVSNFHTHPDATSGFSVFNDVSSDDVQALASGSPPAPSLRQLLLLCLKTMAEEGALAIDGVDPNHRFAAPLPAAAAAVQPAAVQPVAAVAASTAAQPAPPPQPAAVRAPRLVPAVAVAAPSAEELLARLGSRGGNGESTRKRKVNIAATATASILTSTTQGNPEAAAELAARVLGSVQVRRVLGDKLRQTDLPTFKACLVRHGHHYHLAIKAGQRESALAILSSIVDINDRSEVSTANRLNTAALADLLSLAEHPLIVGDEVVLQDGAQRLAFVVQSVNDNDTFDLREKEGVGVRCGVKRAEAIHATDIRVTDYMIKRARRHSRDAGPGQTCVVQKGTAIRIDAAAFASMIGFSTSPAAVRYLSGRSSFSAKRTAIRNDLYPTYKRQCEADAVPFVGRSFFYEHAFDDRFTDDQAEDCMCSTCSTSGAMAFHQFRAILGSLPKCDGAAGHDDFVREQCAELLERVNNLEEFMASEFYTHLKTQDDCAAHCANLLLSAIQDVRYHSVCAHSAAQHEGLPAGTRTIACGTCNTPVDFQVGTFRRNCPNCKATVTLASNCSGCGESCVQKTGKQCKHTLQCTACGEFFVWNCCTHRTVSGSETWCQ